MRHRLKFARISAVGSPNGVIARGKDVLAFIVATRPFNRAYKNVCKEKFCNTSLEGFAALKLSYLETPEIQYKRYKKYHLIDGNEDLRFQAGVPIFVQSCI